MIKLTIYGRLRKFIGQSTFEIKANSAKEAFSFLINNFKGVKEHIRNQEYCIMAGDLRLTEELIDMQTKSDIKIVPVVHGEIFPLIFAGAALGAAALVNKRKLQWEGPYLGTDIDRPVWVRGVIQELLKNKVCGVASEKAEFGPRALGNRSLLGDCRYPIKDTVNNIKQRQKFRPFAPAILEEFADDYFNGPMNEYMQFVAKAKHDYDSVTHVDGTARVQLVKKNCSSVIRQVLELWYEETSVPMLLNTSLNIKGMPIVNTHNDGIGFEKRYGIQVY